MEEAVLPLADRVGDVLQLGAKVDFADHGFERVAFQVRGDRIPIDRTGALERLREHFPICVQVEAGVVVGIDAGDLLVQL